MEESSASNSIQRICDAFIHAKDHGENPVIADFLSKGPEEHRNALLVELMKIEITSRHASGESVDPIEFESLGNDAVVAAQLLVGTPVHRDAKTSNECQILMRPSRTIGPYKLLQQIGEGGMGTVWMAEQSHPVRRRVALKFIKSEFASKETIARFESERQALAMMDHPNIAKVLDAGTTEAGAPYFVMELVKGIPITNYCDNNKLPITERLELFVPVCRAVQHAHQKGIIHRDLKPSNVLVALYDGKPVPKVIDFGLAKALDHTTKLTDKTVFTEFGKVVGTIEYMSPEQAEMSAMDVDTRSDIYSLGVMLYELLTGSTPIDLKTLGKNALLGVLETIREKQPQRPSDRLSSSGDSITGISDQRKITPARLHQILRGELDWVVMKALEKDRTRRYESAGNFAEDLERYSNGDTVLARPASAHYRFGKFVRKHTMGVASVLAIFALLVAGIGGMTWFAIGERSQRKIAQSKTRQAAEEADRANKEANRAQQAEKLAQESAEQSRKDKLAIEKLAKRSQDALAIFTASFRSIDPNRGANAKMLAKDVLFRAKESLDNSDLDNDGKVELLAALTNSLIGVGEYEKAIATAQLEFGIRKSNFGEEHPSTLNAMGRLANAYDNGVQYEKMMELNEKLVGLRKKILGDDHPDTLGSMGSLAGSFGIHGRLDEAISMYEDVVKLQKLKLGVENREVLTSMSNLAHWYGEAERRDEAIELGKQVLAIRKKTMGSDHPHTLTSMGNLAGNYEKLGRRDEALELQDQILDVQKVKLGLDHPNTILTMSNLAHHLHSAGRTDEAIGLGAEALVLRKEKLGEKHPHTLDLASSVAGWYQHSGRSDEAIAMYRENLRKRLEEFGEKDRRTLSDMICLGEVLIASDPEEATKLLSRVYNVRNLQDPDSWLTFNVLSLVGEAKMKSGELNESKLILREAADGLIERAEQIPASVRLARLDKAIAKVVELCEAMDDQESLKEWIETRAKIRQKFSSE